MNPPITKDECLLELLAEHGAVRVARCGCGTVHLSLGALTLRLPEPAYQGLVRALLDARRRMSWNAAALQ